MLKVLLLSLSRQYTVDGQYIPSLFIEPEVRHDKTSYRGTLVNSIIVNIPYLLALTLSIISSNINILGWQFVTAYHLL